MSRFDDRIDRNDDPVITVPYPTQSGIRWHPISYNKIHAIQLGITTGIIAGLATHHIAVEVGTAMLLVLTAYSLYQNHGETIATETIEHKPWYFLPVMLGAYLITAIL